MTRQADDQRVLAGAYAGAHLGKSLFWYAGDLLFVFFLTEFGGLNARSAGLVLGLALAFSAVADLLVAKLLGHRIASTASAGRLQLIGTIACATTFVMFALTAAVDPAGRLAFACAASLLFRAAYAVIDVPQNAILGLAAATDRDRTRLAGLRIVFSGAASLLISALAGLLIASLGRPHAVLTPVMTSAALGAAAVLGAAILAVVARQRASDLALPGAVSIVQVLRRGAVMLPVAMGATVAASTALFNKLEPYFAAFALGSPVAATILLTATALGGVLSQGVWGSLVRRRGPRAVAMLAASALLVGTLLFFGLARLGPWGAAAGGFAYGVGVGGLNLVNWTVLAAAARPLGDRADLGAAATFSAFTFASKLANAAAIILVGELLARFSYRQVGNSGDWPLLGLMCLAPVVGALVYALLARRLPTAGQPRAE
jgi:Na+/melibiose symporter-like transporter